MNNDKSNSFCYFHKLFKGHSDFRTTDYFEIKSPGEIAEGDTFSWSNQLIQIPAVTPSITSCGIITVKYEFQVRINQGR